MNTRIPPSRLGDVSRVLVDVDQDANAFIAYASWTGTAPGHYDAMATGRTIEDAVHDAIDALDSDNDSQPLPPAVR